MNISQLVFIYAYITIFIDNTCNVMIVNCTAIKMGHHIFATSFRLYEKECTVHI